MEELIEKYKQMLKELLTTQEYNFDAELSKNLPKKPGVYIIFEKQNTKDTKKTIYIGQSKSLKRRIIGDHYKGNRVASTLKKKLIKKKRFSDEKNVMNYLSNKCYVQFMEIDDAELQTGFEHFAVAVLRPKLND